MSFLLSDLSPLHALRRRLHDCAEPAGQERRTRRVVSDFFSRLAPQCECVEYAGGSLAFIDPGEVPGPTVVFRAELDAVPLEGFGAMVDGAAHRCGHDGHMAILAGLGMLLARTRLARGRVVLLFQAAEEDGSGALSLVEDKGFRTLRPDLIFALHNLPGWPMGQVMMRSESMCCASRGLEITLRGRPSHAAHPELGRSPAQALAQLIEFMASLGGVGEDPAVVCMATVVGARLGERHFGSSPASANLWVTLRSDTDAAMEDLCGAAVREARDIAAREDLRADFDWLDVFPAVTNDARACALVRAAADQCGIPCAVLERPFRWSEDFAHYAKLAPAALFGIGAGEACAPLHDRAYAFPEDLLAPAITLLGRLAGVACP